MIVSCKEFKGWRMLKIIIYDSGLQLLSSLPKKFMLHPAIISDLKKRKKTSGLILLDITMSIIVW